VLLFVSLSCRPAHDVYRLKFRSPRSYRRLLLKVCWFSIDPVDPL